MEWNTWVRAPTVRASISTYVFRIKWIWKSVTAINILNVTDEWNINELLWDTKWVFSFDLPAWGPLTIFPRLQITLGVRGGLVPTALCGYFCALKHTVCLWEFPHCLLLLLLLQARVKKKGDWEEVFEGVECVWSLFCATGAFWVPLLVMSLCAMTSEHIAGKQQEQREALSRRMN